MGNDNDSDAKSKAHKPYTANLRKKTDPPSTCRRVCHLQRLQRSTLTEEDHIQGDVTCQSHLTQSFAQQKNFAGANCPSMMRRRAPERSASASAHPFLIGGEKVTFSIREHSFHRTKGKNQKMNQTPLASPFTRHGWCIPALFWAFQSFCQRN